VSARQPIIAANWKMHLTHLEAIQTVQKLSYLVTKEDAERVEVVICPPFTAIRSVQTVIQSDRLPFGLGAQNVHWEAKGAFTGEVAPGMLQALQCTYVIVGHSERRQYFGETDETVNKKVKAVFGAGMTPIMCVGETLEEREADATEAKVTTQVEAGLAGLKADRVAAMVIAYEPIWAIGTGRTATPDDAQAVCSLLRSTVARVFTAEAAESLRIQYGGSVKAENIADLMAQEDIDGALVGGASLDPDEFARIAQYPRL
jgi:triosephosphate isomerase